MNKRALLLSSIFPKDTQAGMDWLSKLPVFVIDNVADYLFRGTDQEYWDVLDFPNAAPPFPEFWMEFTTPEISNSEVLGQVRVPSLQVGALFTAVDLKNPAPVIDTFPEPFLELCSEKASVPVRWVVCAMLFIPVLDPLSSPLVCANYLGVDENGKVVLRIDAPADPNAEGRGVFSIVMMVDRFAETPGMFNTYLHVTLLALSFLHCRNVTVEDHNPLPRKIRNRAEITVFHGAPVIRHKTLHIHAMRKILETEGGSGTKGLKQALHICRGHFKTFEEDAPLFGKHTGTYWWNPMVRGRASQGEVRKRYDVHPPEEP